MSNHFYSLREQTTASELARRQSTASRTPGTNGPRPRNPVMSPSPRSTNPFTYGPLETETDDDESNQSINNNRWVIFSKSLLIPGEVS